MKCQIYEIINGEIRYIYNGVRGLRFSKCRATTFTEKEAREIVKEISHHKLFICTKGNSLYKETDATGLFIDLQRAA